MKKVVKKYDKGGIKPKGVSQQVASATGLPAGAYINKPKTSTKPTNKTITKSPVKKVSTNGISDVYRKTKADGSKVVTYKSSYTTALGSKNPTQVTKVYNKAGKLVKGVEVVKNKNSGGTLSIPTMLTAEQIKKQNSVKKINTPVVKKPAIKTPVKAPVKQPVKTAYDVLKDKQAAVKNPRIGTPVKSSVATSPKKTATVKKAAVKTNPAKTVENQVTPLTYKKVSDLAPIKTVSAADINPVSKNTTVNRTISDKMKPNTANQKSIAGMGERLTAYNNANRPSVNTTSVATESKPAKISLIDKIKNNIAQRKMKKINKLSEQVGQSRAMGSYAQPTMKKGGVKKMAKGGFPDLNKDGKITKADILKGRGVIKKKGGATMDKYQKGGTKKPMMSPAKIKVTSDSKKPSYNEVFKTKKK